MAGLISLPAFTMKGQPEAEPALSDSTGLPGDHFSLEGALDLFKTSASPEDFEKKLNAEHSKVNNLDLNGDGNTDYVRVEDKMEKDAHALILRVDVSEKETQDIAVIEIEKTGSEKAQLQIVGSKEIYGDEKIVEPFEQKDADNSKGPGAKLLSYKVVINVWMWPGVKFIYAPVYTPWVSPWYWGYYPGWWKPWKVRPWRWHWRACRSWHAFYHPVFVHRVVVAHKVYSPFRKTSVVVVNKYKVAHANYHVHKTKSGGKVNSPGKTVGGHTVLKEKKHSGNTMKTAKGGMKKANPGMRRAGGGGGRGKRK